MKRSKFEEDKNMEEDKNIEENIIKVARDLFRLKKIKQFKI